MKNVSHQPGTKNTGEQLELIHEQKDIRETWLHAAMRAKTNKLLKPYLEEYFKIWRAFPEVTHKSEVEIIKSTTTTIGDEKREHKELKIIADEVYVLESSNTKKYIIFECETKSVTHNLQNKIDRYRQAFNHYTTDIKVIFVLDVPYDINKLCDIPRWIKFIFLPSGLE